MSNLRLKIAFHELGVPIYRTAIEGGFNPNRVSKFISGLAEPSPEEKQKLATILDRPIKELFPEQPTGVAE